MRNKRDEIRQAIIIYRSLSYIWCNCGSHRIHHGHLPHCFSLSLGGGVGHWQTSRHLPGIKCLRLTIACASCRCVRRLWQRCSQLLCWWFVLDTGHGESFLTLAYTKLIILLILFGFSFVFWPQTFLLAHKKKTAIRWQHRCKTKQSKRCSSCCNFFLADLFLICIPGVTRLLMRFAEA